MSDRTVISVYTPTGGDDISIIDMFQRPAPDPEFVKSIWPKIIYDHSVAGSGFAMPCRTEHSLRLVGRLFRAFMALEVAQTRTEEAKAAAALAWEDAVSHAR